ncbi:MAG: helix-turn-helix domain-containing protein [Muribaculaceae bacterium]|nr:helix-turn-helix domain-containing protein [Muribaculaceae bacterium]
MQRLDLAALRKAHNINQIELAKRLDMKQSFISAIENGKSPLPSVKLALLRELFGEEEVDKFMVEAEDKSLRLNIENLSESDMMAQLLRMFHSHEHKEESHNHEMHHRKIDELQERISRLLERNDRLADKCMTLRERLDHMTAQNIEAQNEIFRLKELLLSNGIRY